MVEYHVVLGITAGVVQIASAVPYVFSMIRGSTRPNAISYILWVGLALVAFSAQVSAGASWSLIILGALIFNMIVITALALNGYGYRSYTFLDYACLVIVILAVVLWYVTSEPILAFSLAVIANVLPAIPTFVKTYRDPHSELAIAWFLAILAAIFGLLSTIRWDIQNVAFPQYLLIEATIIWALAFFGQRITNRTQV